MQVDATGLFGSERDAFLDLLGDLSDQEWQLATECPEWTVKGVALHVLGDDLSLLARQRDGATDSLTLFAEGRPGLDVGDLLDGFNEQWVTAASFLGPQLVVELLGLTGTWTERFYGSCDLDALGEPVGWFGATGPSPMWQAIARELIERWVHHHQILRAVGRPPLGGPVADMAERIALAGGAYRLADLGAAMGDEVEVRMGSRSWTLLRIQDGWSLAEGPANAPRALLGIAPNEVASLLTRGPNTAASTTTFEGDAELAVAVGLGLMQ